MPRSLCHAVADHCVGGSAARRLRQRKRQRQWWRAIAIVAADGRCRRRASDGTAGPAARPARGGRAAGCVSSLSAVCGGSLICCSLLILHALTLPTRNRAFLVFDVAAGAGTRPINLKNKSGRPPVFHFHGSTCARLVDAAAAATGAPLSVSGRLPLVFSTAAALCDRRRTVRLQIIEGCGGPCAPHSSGARPGSPSAACTPPVNRPFGRKRSCGGGCRAHATVAETAATAAAAAADGRRTARVGLGDG